MFRVAVKVTHCNSVPVVSGGQKLGGSSRGSFPSGQSAPPPPLVPHSSPHITRLPGPPPPGVSLGLPPLGPPPGINGGPPQRHMLPGTDADMMRLFLKLTVDFTASFSVRPQTILLLKRLELSQNNAVPRAVKYISYV